MDNKHLQELGEKLAVRADLTVTISGGAASGKTNLELFLESVVNATPELRQRITVEAATLDTPHTTHFTIYRNRG